MRHVILGNGPAGVVAAETLRKAAPRDDIVLLGDEPEPPYSRMAIPYLLAGEIDEPGTHLRKSAGHFESLGITLRQARAQRVDTAKREVALSDGSTLGYDRLLIATGSHPIRPPIPGMDLPGVLTCWTLDDARKIIAGTRPGARVLQIGAGFIGCIILEALASRGVELTVVEMGDRMVPRMMTAGAGGMIKRWCETKGVKVHTGARVQSLRAEGAAIRVTLDSAAEVIADVVICAAGVKSNVAFLQGSGIEVKTGVLIDERMQTNVPGVYAAGDCAEAIDMSTGERIVNAIQPSAVDQARVAALNMAGHGARSQGSLTINVLDTLGLISSSFGKWWGDPQGESVELDDATAHRYLSLQFKDDVLIGATAIGLTEHVGVLRGLIQSRTRLGKWKDHLLADPTRLMEAYLACAQAQAGWPVTR